MSVSTIKDQEGKEYLIFDETELYDDSEMGEKLEDFDILQILGKGSYGFVAKVRSIKNNKIYFYEWQREHKSNCNNRP